MAYAAEKVLKTSLLSWPLSYHFSVRTTSRQTEIYDSILMTTEKELGDLNFSKRRWRLIATRRLRRRSIFAVKRNCWHYLWRWLYYAIDPDSTSISTLLIKSFKKENSSRTATFFNRVFSHDVRAAMLVSQTSPVGVELLSYANVFFCANKFV